MSNCPVCGANFPETRFVCEYCGHVETERVKQVSDDKSIENSFSNSMDIIKQNLDALLEVHIPTAKEAILEIVRFFTILNTWGLALAFWKKPKKRFNKAEYNKLASIVRRNILDLKISSTGSNDLLAKILIIEEELLKIDTEIKKGVKAKTFTFFAVIGIYVLFIIAYFALMASLGV
jgi:hypothetical protein